MRLAAARSFFHFSEPRVALCKAALDLLFGATSGGWNGSFRLALATGPDRHDGLLGGFCASFNLNLSLSPNPVLMSAASTSIGGGSGAGSGGNNTSPQRLNQFLVKRLKQFAVFVVNFLAAWIIRLAFEWRGPEQ